MTKHKLGYFPICIICKGYRSEQLLAYDCDLLGRKGAHNVISQGAQAATELGFCDTEGEKQ